MSDCGRLSDRMPAVALGRSTWTTAESGHLGGCASCQEEWNLIQLTSQLGASVGARLDHSATTRAVLDRLARSEEQNRLRRRSWGFAALASAAAVAVMVWSGRVAPPPGEPGRTPVVASLQIPLPELDYLLPAELNAVLNTLDEPLVGGSAADTAAVDPDDEVLETGFDTWEG
jgi:hypothetical protein